jgi:hypothetical protein
MALFSNLTSDTSIKGETDTLGVGFGPLESGLYNGKVTMAYGTLSKGGAQGLVINIQTEDNKEIRQTLWMTSGTAKGAKNYYEKDGEKNYLPGYIAANALCLLASGKEISDMETEVKVVKVYSFEQKTEVPTKVDAVMDLIGKDIVVGLIKQTVDKNAKNESTGAYEPTGDTRDENEIDKFFRASDRLTTAEIKAQATEPGFILTWETKWTGKTRNKAKGASGTAGAPKAGVAPSTAAKKPSTSLFSK